LTNDTEQLGTSNLDGFFSDGVEFVAVQYNYRPNDKTGTYETTLTFTTKVRSEVTPDAVQIRGAPSLINGATYDSVGDDRVAVSAAWNRLLADDGKSEDGNPNDRIFAKKVKLANAKSPRAYEMVFFDLVFGTGPSAWAMEFPYIFPPLTPAKIGAQYEPAAKLVRLTGYPFGSKVEDFIWTVNICTADSGKVMYQSDPIPGTTRQFTIPSNILDPSASYKYYVIAQTLDKVPGYPAYTVQSPKQTLKQ
jgi:hypothetical protein